VANNAKAVVAASVDELARDPMAAPFADHREAARAILRAALDSKAGLRPKEGQFLGGLSFDANPPTIKQIDWLVGLLDRAGLPTLEREGAE
jgi:hypothetical protein